VVKFKTDIQTVSRMQQMMDDWMVAEGAKMELELSKNEWMKQLSDFTMAFDLDYLRREKEPNNFVICELSGRAPTKRVLVYRFVCSFEGSDDSRPVVMDVEESIYDEACRSGRWEVVPA
jgi:hypothetical protein